jgi:peptidoglycan/LPS O-acetylase OafA/YrhL
VLVATGLAGVALYSEFSLKRLGSDIVWSSVFSTNWLFVLRSIDYLAWDETQKSALLHYWSLAVEEQFYLLWPLTLLALLRLRDPRHRPWAIGLLAAASLAWCVVQSSNNQTSAFFATPARAWELLVGAWLAVVGLPHFTRFAAAGAAVGVLLIGVAALAFSDDTRHPGLITLVPVLGCALVIACGSASRFATRVLGHAAMQAVGARSYSIYLWHLPVLQLGASWTHGQPAVTGLALLLFALATAEIAYRFVERPARFGWVRHWSARRVLGVALLAAALVAAFGLALRAFGANDMRELLGFTPAVRAASQLPPLARVRADLPEVYRAGCHLGVDSLASPPCEYGRVGASESVVLFGDSHAAQWFSAIDAVAASYGLALFSWTKSSCPSAGVAVWNAVAKSAYRQCDAWREATLTRIEALRPRWVILSNLIEASPLLVDPRGAGPMRGRDVAQAWSEGFEQLVRRLQLAGIGVIVIRDVPRPRPDVLDCIYAAPDPRRCELSLGEATTIPPIDAAVARRTGAVLWDLSGELCPEGRCTVVRADTRQPVYRDFNHLTDTEVRRLVPAMAARWARDAAPPRQPLR